MESPQIEISDPLALLARPRVSVYMLAFRHEKFISEAINGVISQECGFPFELIIGEDCSPDSTREIALDYQRRYPHLIRVLTSSANVGPHENARRCLLATRGSFVALCEADDYWHHPRKLQMQVAALEDHPTAQLVHTDFDRQIGERVLRNAHAVEKTPHLASGDAFRSLLFGNSVTTATAMYRRPILDELSNTNLPLEQWPFGDYPKALYAAMRGPVVYLPISTATYRNVAGSAMNQGRAKALKMQLAGLDCREHFMNLGNFDSEEANSIRAHVHRLLLQQYVRLGDANGYRVERDWLALNGFRERRIASLANEVLVSSRPALNVYRAALKVIHEHRKRRHYKPIERREPLMGISKEVPSAR